jgi:hypothetical protein
VIERAHVVQAPDFEGDLLDVVRFLPGLLRADERELVVLGIRRRAEETDPALEILVADREAQDARVEVAHLLEVLTVEADVAESYDLGHGLLLAHVCL